MSETGDRLDADTLQSLSAAFEEARSILGLRAGDPRTFGLAKRIIELAQTGEHDPRRLCDSAVRAFTVLSPAS
jgi:hypothetical protein